MNRQFLIRLRESVEFREVMAEAAKTRPVVPQWQPAGGESAEQLLEQIKFQTGAQLGFDSLFMLLTGKDMRNVRAD